MTEDKLALRRQICFALYAASNLMTRIYRRPLETIGLTYSQYIVMLVLWEKDRQTVAQISERLHLSPATVTPLLKKLQSAGLVNKERCTEDERRVFVSLTKKGAALRSDAENTLDEIICNIGMDEERADDIRVMLYQLIENLQNTDVRKIRNAA